MLSQIDAVVLAGDREGSKPVKEENKAFLKIHGKECLLHVLAALFESRYIAKVAVVGPIERIQSVCFREYGSHMASKRLRLVQQENNIIENIKSGFFSFIPDFNESHLPLAALLSHPDLDIYREKPILILPSDIPLILSHEIDQFCSKTDMDSNDYAIGITDKSVLARFYPTAENPGIKMSCFLLKDGSFRQNNLHMGKLLKVTGLHYIEKVYQLRYQKKILNMIRTLFIILSKGRSAFESLNIIFRLQLARYAHELNLYGIERSITNTVSIEWILRVISPMLGVSTQVVTTTYGGAALDVDNEDDFEAAKRMFERWIELQQ